MSPVSRLRRVLIALFCFVLVSFCFSRSRASEAADQAALARVTQQFRDYYFGSGFEMKGDNEAGPDLAHAAKFAQTLSPDGSWPDINYRGVARSAWEPAAHYTRMLAMAGAAGRARVSPTEHDALLAATHRAFSFWIEHDYQCPNWWYNEIGTPQSLGTTAVLLGDGLTPKEAAYMIGTLLARFPIGRTGQNRIWLAGNVLMRGLLMRNPALVQRASSTTWNEVRITPEEGLQADDSFHQHGPQQQFGNYGLAFAVEECHFNVILRDSPWSMPAPQLAIFRDYLLNGLNWVSWRGAFDISACGRQLMPHSPRNKTKTISQVMQLSALTDPAHAPEYSAYVARNRAGPGSSSAGNDLTGDRYFYRSDYYIHRTSTYAATLKMSSQRVIGEETVNSENLSGYHLADGALFLYASGQEYDEIFPLWDWSKIPGTTCTTAGPPRFKTSQVPTGFVGGIAPGGSGGSALSEWGLAALDYDRDGVKAHKSWFFSPEGVICLGAGISGPANVATQTTVNQSRRNGQITSASSEWTGSSRSQSAPQWIEHDGWRYTPFESTKWHVETVQATGSWKKVYDNPTTPKAPVTGQLFLLSIDHGKAARNQSYAYAATKAGHSPHGKILANRPDVQAVALSSDTFGIAFWTAGEFELPGGGTIRTDAPSLIWIEAKRTLVCDPTQKLAEITVTVNGHPKTLSLPRGQTAGTAAVY